MYFPATLQTKKWILLDKSLNLKHNGQSWATLAYGIYLSNTCILFTKRQQTSFVSRKNANLAHCRIIHKTQLINISFFCFCPSLSGVFAAMKAMLTAVITALRPSHPVVAT